MLRFENRKHSRRLRKSVYAKRSLYDDVNLEKLKLQIHKNIRKVVFSISE
jgi:hypothetical protein